MSWEPATEIFSAQWNCLQSGFINKFISKTLHYVFVQSSGLQNLSTCLYYSKYQAYFWYQESSFQV